MSDQGNRDRRAESSGAGSDSGALGANGANGGGLFGNRAMVAYTLWVIRWRWAIILATVRRRRPGSTPKSICRRCGVWLHSMLEG